MANKWELMYPKLPRSWWAVRFGYLVLVVAWLIWINGAPQTEHNAAISSSVTPILLASVVVFAVSDMVVTLRARKALRERLY